MTRVGTAKYSPMNGDRKRDDMSPIDTVDRNVAISMFENSISLSINGIRLPKLSSPNVAIAVPAIMFMNRISFSKSRSKIRTKPDNIDVLSGTVFSSLDKLKVKEIFYENPTTFKCVPVVRLYCML